MATEAGPREKQLESGTSYTLTNVMTGAPITIEPNTYAVVGTSRYTGSPFQVWEATSASGFWTFKNVETGLYLGHNQDTVVKDCEEIRATTHPFTWQVKQDASGKAKICVPYTNFVVDKTAGHERKVISHSSHDGDNQRWILNPDLNIFQLPIEPRSLYKIVCSKAGTVANMDDSGFVTGHSYNEGRNQKWEAIPSDTGTWFFKNHFTGKYLGIEKEIAGNSIRVVGTDQPFAWDIARKYVNGEPCKRNGVMLRVPSTQFFLNLDRYNRAPGTRMHLWSDPVGYWILEKVQPY